MVKDKIVVEAKEEDVVMDVDTDGVVSPTMKQRISQGMVEEGVIHS